MVGINEYGPSSSINSSITHGLTKGQWEMMLMFLLTFTGRNAQWSNFDLVVY